MAFDIRSTIRILIQIALTVTIPITLQNVGWWAPHSIAVFVVALVVGLGFWAPIGSSGRLSSGKDEPEYLVLALLFLLAFVGLLYNVLYPFFVSNSANDIMPKVFKTLIDVAGFSEEILEIVHNSKPNGIRIIHHLFWVNMAISYSIAALVIWVMPNFLMKIKDVGLSVVVPGIAPALKEKSGVLMGISKMNPISKRQRRQRFLAVLYTFVALFAPYIAPRTFLHKNPAASYSYTVYGGMLWLHVLSVLFIGALMIQTLGEIGRDRKGP